MRYTGNGQEFHGHLGPIYKATWHDLSNTPEYSEPKHFRKRNFNPSSQSPYENSQLYFGNSSPNLFGHQPHMWYITCTQEKHLYAWGKIYFLKNENVYQQGTDEVEVAIRVLSRVISMNVYFKKYNIMGEKARKISSSKYTKIYQRGWAKN